jgi:hypothetical protein
MLSNAEAKRQRRQLLKEISAEHKRADRETLKRLRHEIKHVKARRREAMKDAVAFCRTGRVEARERAKVRALELRAAAKEAIRLARIQEREAARSSCDARKREISESPLTSVAKARAAVKAERKYQKDLKRIESELRAKTRHQRTSSRERSSESDDEVRQNIPAELLPLFERVKRSIKGSTRQSRTEAFMLYAEENPHEVVDAQEGLAQREIARLIREEHALARAMRSPHRYKPTAAELSAIPF